ncbi:MAG: glycosyltransferase [Chloroflexales bacterium]|nr:glycosyltransferase [Chloroflexales bacterium]
MASSGATAICTIVAKNYLAYARTLAESFYIHHPTGRMFVLVVDQPEGYFDPAREPFTVVTCAELDIPHFAQMAFRYTVLELCTAVKPFLLEHLIDHYDLDHVIYLDPDIACYAALTPLRKPLRSHQIVLTPHLLAPLDDARSPSELEILQAGSYNLGCIGVARGPELRPFLRWWQRHLERDCLVDIGRGLFVDQRWLDLAPALFSSVAIVRDAGCNVAYWNLSHRSVSATAAGWMCNGVPLRFYHFSGLPLDNLDAISRHQDRATLAQLPQLRPLFEGYRERLLAHGHAESRTWPYSYAVFDHGVPIPELARQLWRTKDGERHWPDPFAAGAAGGFFVWLNQEAHPQAESSLLVTNLALAIYQLRLDLQQAFPDVVGAHRRAFVGWFLYDAEQQHHLSPTFVQPMRAQLLDTEQALSGEQPPRAVRRPIVDYWRSAVRRLTMPLPEAPLVGKLTFSRRLYYAFRNPLRRLGLHTALKRVIGLDRVMWLLNTMVLDAADPPAPVRAIQRAVTNFTDAPATLERPAPGLNIVGYLSHPTGVGEVARSVAAALANVGMPLARIDVSAEPPLAAVGPYDCTLMCVNADMTPYVRQSLGPGPFHERRTIGFWHWETSRFPREWRSHFALLDELWVASDFVRHTLAPLSPVPVLTMRVPVLVYPAQHVSRANLGLPDERFLWLFAFDAHSYIVRKNPSAVIEAYRRAFGATSASTHLVIKAHHIEAYPEEAAQLQAEVAAVGGTLITEVMDRSRLAALFFACDGYVSLHRSEGFGLTMAEAMALGKPVVATGYSGNLEFMTPTNSYLVNYQLVNVDPPSGMYKADHEWADPDVDHAASLMATVVHDPHEATCRAQRAAADMRHQFAPPVIAQTITDRLDILRCLASPAAKY